MKLQERKPSGREKDEAAVALLAQLRQKLHADEISFARKAAFNLSWMQEDGLDILREALLGNTPRRSKSAAAYGLRKMRGRMRKKAEETLVEGMAHPDRATAETCRNALIVLKRGKSAPKRPPRPTGRGGGTFEIREVPGRDDDRSRGRRPPQRGRRPDDHTPSSRRR